MEQIVILGAGSPHRGDTPAVDTAVMSGVSALSWNLAILSKLSLPKPTLVLGYRASEVAEHYQEQAEVVENSGWSVGGAVDSLFQVDFSKSTELSVIYGDAIFHEETLSKLFESSAPISVLFDTSWKERFVGRHPDDLANAEKVMTADNLVTRIGTDVPLEWARGEFAGAIRFRGAALQDLQHLRDQWLGNRPLPRISTVPEVAESLRAKGHITVGIDCSHGWAEIREPQDVSRFIMGTKAKTLERLRGATTKSIIQDQVTVTKFEWNTDSASALSTIRAKFDEQPLVVRSSSSDEDSFSSSQAGVYESFLGVKSSGEISHAISQVFESYRQDNENDVVLIQPQVTNVGIGGVCFTRSLQQHAPNYVINFTTSGDTDGVTSGSAKEQKTLVVRRESASTANISPSLKAVLDAVREIEILLEYDALDIEFAVDKAGAVHVFQVRPMTGSGANVAEPDSEINAFVGATKARWLSKVEVSKELVGAKPVFGVMPDWNPAEMIGLAPGALAESLYSYLVTDETWAVQRFEYSGRDLRGYPLMMSFAGKPYIDVGASVLSFIPDDIDKELSQRLASFFTRYLSERPHLHDKLEFEVLPTCLDLDFAKWEKRLRDSQEFSVEEVKEFETSLRRVTRIAIERVDSFWSALDLLDSREIALDDVDASIDPLDRAIQLLGEAKWLGVLPFAHLARTGFIAISLLKSGVANKSLSPEAYEEFLGSIRSVGNEFVSDLREVSLGRISTERIQKKYGHLRPGTYDILSPRYDSNPELYFQLSEAEDPSAKLRHENESVWSTEKHDFLASVVSEGLADNPEQVDKFLRRAIEGREYGKFLFTKSVSVALEHIAKEASRCGLRRSDIANIPIDVFTQVKKMSLGEQDRRELLLAIAAANERKRRLGKSVLLPHLLSDSTDFDFFTQNLDVPNFVGSQTVRAPAVFLESSETHGSLKLEGKIVLIENADPGFDWVFSKGIVGLITVFGGSNSHMSIRAAEFSLPAAIGVGEGTFVHLQGSELVELDPSSRTLRRLR